MKILIIGVGGQIGSAVNRRLRESNWDISTTLYADLNICNESDVRRVITRISPNVIINCAAYTSVVLAERDMQSANQVNCDGIRNIGEAAESIGAFVIHFSTDYVFSGDKVGRYNEQDFAEPINAYGQSKLAGEKALAQVSSRYLILRTSWVFSAHSNNFVHKIIQRAKSNKSFKVVADQEGAPTCADDIANVVLTVLQHYEKNGAIAFGIYHYSGFPSVSWYEFACQIVAIAKSAGIISSNVVLEKSDSGGDVIRRPLNSKLDCNKILRNFLIHQDDWRLQIEKVIIEGNK